MFILEPNLCDIIKPIKVLTKADSTLVSASVKNSTIQFSQFNIDQQILFLHQVNNQKVKELTRFSIESDRISALVANRAAPVTIEYKTDNITYSSGKSKGYCTVSKYEPLEKPIIKADKTLTALVRKYFKFLSLKPVVVNTECFLTIEEESKFTKITVTDNYGYHAVQLKIKTRNKQTNSLTIPLIYIQNAIRLLKENIQICSDEGHLYCYIHNDKSTSIIRFRNIIDSSGINSKVLSDSLKSEDLFNIKTTADSFNPILNDYKIIKEKDKSQNIFARIKNRKLHLTINNSLGGCESSFTVKSDKDIKFELPILLLEDCLRLKEGHINMGLKKDHNIFYIKQINKDFSITYLFAATKHED